MKDFTEMGRGSTGRLLLRYSLPAIASMVLVTLYNVIDRIFVGQATGTTGLAAVTVAFPVMILGFAPAILANAGGSSLVARLLGTGDTAGAERAVGQSVLLGTVLSVVIGLVLLPFVDPLLWLFGASEATIVPARQFSLLMIASFPFQGMGMGLSAGVRSQGKAKTAMFLMLAGIILNTLFCAVFVLGLGWGVAGSGLATLLGQAFGALIGLGFYWSGAGALRLRMKNIKPHSPTLAEIAKVGSSAGIGNVVPVVVILILNRVVMYWAGDTGLAVIGIVNTISMIAVMPVIGILQAAGPLMGYNHGAGDWPRVRRVFWQALIAATAVLTTAWLTMQVFPEAYIRAFSAGDPGLLELGKRCVMSYMLFLPLLSLPIALGQYYQSLGLGLHALILGLSRQIIFLVPALLIMPAIWGLDGIIWAGPVSDGLGIFLTLGFLAWELPRLKAGRPAPGEKPGATGKGNPAKPASELLGQGVPAESKPASSATLVGEAAPD